ncbi:hypothetical protein BpHYR1_054037 [Brachionus plicatilis]|uniref:Uncharacterized protein n=1 Tax=Brachionus plicatilis TaxID=10195 RepID=A0A3M7QGB5_BRAPC|nr:hypothetical protein BpHYR1_054037 [Brachionus plicatilis]
MLTIHSSWHFSINFEDYQTSPPKNASLAKKFILKFFVSKINNKLFKSPKLKSKSLKLKLLQYSIIISLGLNEDVSHSDEPRVHPKYLK